MGLGSADDVAGLGRNGRMVCCIVPGSLDDWAAQQSGDTGGLRDRDELRAHRNLLLEGRAPALAVGRGRVMRERSNRRPSVP